jgi:tricorn protease
MELQSTLRLSLTLGCLLGAAASAIAAPGYFRHPAIHGDTVVFTAEGDLWRVGVSGGTAQRLTTHPGTESHASFSPDGRTIAFTAEYEGPAEAYVMPLEGGLPTRLTFDGGATVIGWTPEGRVIYRTSAYAGMPASQLATVDPSTLSRSVIPLAQASEGVWEPASKNFYFTRLPKQGSATKRYKGGWIENLWRYTEGGGEAVPLAPDFAGTSRTPMWWQGRVYFVSDRDAVMNLWSMKPDGSDIKALTKHTGFDVKSASLQGGRIVYSRGADLHLLDIATGADRVLSISLPSDFDQTRERWVSRPLDYLTSARISWNGDRLALTARGEVFVAPQEDGRIVEMPRKEGVRYRSAVFAPDGKSITLLSDESGEFEFWKFPANGIGATEKLTTNATVFRFESVPSPDGKRMAWGDKDQRLWVMEVGKSNAVMIAESGVDEINDFAWSPDSRWIAYVEGATNSYPQIRLYGVEDGTRVTVTSDRVDSYSPAWSPDGNWLYFLSDRELRSLVPSPWGPRQPDPFFTDTTKIYAVALKADAKWPFAEKNELQEDDSKKDEKKKDKDKEEKKTDDKKSDDKKEVAESKDSKDKDDKKSGETNAPSVKPIVIEVEGLASRLYEVPVPAGNYRDLAVTAKHLLWGARDTGFETKSQLRQLEITRKDPKPKTLVDEVGSWQVSGDGKKVLIRKGNTFHVIAPDASAPAKLDDKFNLDGWALSVSPREEWRQIYTEAWRMLRDYFYDRGMHGNDWKAIHAKYLPLIDRVTDRAELSDVIAEMAGELSALHIFVNGGDERDGPDQIRLAALGARLTHDPAAGGWRIDRIYRTDPDFPGERPPLAQPGVGAKAGDVITAINGRSVSEVADIGLLLRNQAGRQVLLDLKDSTTNRQVVVKPISRERDSSLRYSEWEYTRRTEVDRMSANQIGYVHLRAMGGGDIADWARGFYPVHNRQGLIIDVRNNQGGNIDSWILGKLLRKAWFYWKPRVGEPTWNMQYAFRGHIVVLCNERTASDGEAFSEGFKRLGLGKVIGTRTWGGEIWLSARRWLVDSGMASAAELGVYGPEGDWLIEGHGVDPDIVVDNPPVATFQGRDAQLEAAVKHLQELIAKDPRPVPATPKYPIKKG